MLSYRFSANITFFCSRCFQSVNLIFGFVHIKSVAERQCCLLFVVIVFLISRHPGIQQCASDTELASDIHVNGAVSRLKWSLKIRSESTAVMSHRDRRQFVTLIASIFVYLRANFAL